MDSTAASAPRGLSCPQAWTALAQRRVYFAHQSVGADVIAGMEHMMAHGDAPAMKFVQTRHPSVLRGPAFVHFQAGSNANVRSKWKTLHEVLDDRPAPDHALVLLKYCYADVTGDDDAEALFTAYRGEVASLTERHPDITMVHATVPLTTVEPRWKAVLKRRLGRAVVRDAALQRHSYNQRVRAAFAATEPLFDIARAESEGRDGRRAAAMIGGSEVEILADDFTHDGGHLNAAGRIRAAMSLLAALERAVAEPR